MSAPVRTSGVGRTEYDRLMADLQGLRALRPGPSDLRSAAEDFLTWEADLLDTGRLEEWLQLFRLDGIYWIPSSPRCEDPRTNVSLAFDDRRRLDDRVFWLRTGLATCQIPPSRTRHVIGNVIVGPGESDASLVRSNFLLAEHRAGKDRIFSGWFGHVLTGLSGPLDGVRVRTKIVCLTEADAGHENLTLIF